MLLLTKTMLFVEPVAITFLLVYTFGYLSRYHPSPNTLNTAMGVIFGLATVAAMMSPIEIGEGLIVDVRCLFIGFVAGFFGLTAGVVALTIGILTRIGIGGDGTYIGLAAMSISSIMGLIWHYFAKPRVQNDTVGILLLATMISFHLVVGTFLPTEVHHMFFYNLAPFLVAANFAGSLLLNKLISHERASMAEVEKLAYAASVDPLTKLINRDKAVHDFNARPSHSSVDLGTAFICFDIDKFKLINDTFGHLRGDDVLIAIADRITSCLRPDDIFSRLSGDEFLFILNDLSCEQSKIVADRCRRAICSTPIVTNGAEINVTISLGVTWTHKRKGFLTMRDAADEALYRAKEVGKNCVAYTAIKDGIAEEYANAASAA